MKRTKTSKIIPRREGSSIPKPSLSAHYQASRLRADTWNQLKTSTHRLTEGGDNNERLLLEVKELFSIIEPVESYWAFPGREKFAYLERMLRRGEYRNLAHTVERIVRALV